MAQKLLDIISNLPSPALKRAYVIYMLNEKVQEKIADNLADKINITAFSRGTLTIETPSHAWAQELQFQKERIKEILKEDKLVIKKINIFVNTSKKEVMDQDKKDEKECQNCGRLILGRGNTCPQCKNTQEKKINSAIRSIIKETPWLKYTEAKEVIDQDFSEDQFIAVRERLRSETFDYLKKFSYELHTKGSPVLRKELQQRAVFYTMLKNLLTIDKINDKIIRRCLGGMLHSVIYKKTSKNEEFR